MRHGALRGRVAATPCCHAEEPAAVPSGSRARTWRARAVVAGLAALALLAFAFVQLHPSPATGVAGEEGREGYLLVPATGFEGVRLWVWDLATDTARKGPPLAAMPKELVESVTLQDTWVGFTTPTRGRAYSASVLRRLGPTDRPIVVARGRFVTWTPVGGYVSVARSHPLGGCHYQLDVRTWFVTIRQEEHRFSGAVCGRPVAFGRDRLLPYVALDGPGGLRIAQVGNGYLSTRLRGRTILSISNDGDLLVQAPAGPLELSVPARLPDPSRRVPGGAAARRGPRVEPGREPGVRSRHRAWAARRLPPHGRPDASTKGARARHRHQRRQRCRDDLGGRRSLPRHRRRRAPVGRRRAVDDPAAAGSGAARWSDPVGVHVAILLAGNLMEIAIVGAGTVGTAVAVAWRRAGHDIVAVSGRAATADRAADWLPGVPVRPLQEVATGAAVVVLGVPDDALDPTVGALGPTLEPTAWLVHLSGARGLDVLRASAARPLAIHPLQTFADIASALEALPGCAVAVTADDEEGRAIGGRLAEDLGGRPFRLADDDRPLYHAAAVFASNYLVAVSGAAAALFDAAGVPDPTAAMRPLQRATLDNVARLGPAIRSPARRCEATAARSSGTSPRSRTRRRTSWPRTWPSAVWRSTWRGPGSTPTGAPLWRRCSTGGADPRRGDASDHGGRLALDRRDGWARADDGRTPRWPRVAAPPRASGA